MTIQEQRPSTRMLLAGVYPILPTIFSDDGQLDIEGMRNVMEHILAVGADGIVYPGLASEYDMLSTDERLEMTTRLGEWIGGRVPFVVGASSPDEKLATQFACSGAQAGAIAAMILTPQGHAGDLQRMAGYFDAIHAASGIDIMLQNAPAPMGVGLTVEQVAWLVERVAGIRYVKEETQPSGQRMTQLNERVGNSLDAVFGGAGARYVLDELVRGAKGTMPACEVTEVHVAMLRAFNAGEVDHARELFERTLPLLSVQAVFRWRLTKAVLKRRGLIASDYVRAPGPKLDEFDQREVDALLERVSDLLSLDRVPSAART
jgi:dihydrodipicolinate synthase/N-acetylneuraminate lyase